MEEVGEGNSDVKQPDSMDGGWPSGLRPCVLLNKSHIVRNTGAAGFTEKLIFY